MTQPLAVEYIAADKIIPYARNTRTHSEEQIAQIAASIKEFGFNNPILIDPDNVIIAGHGRLLGAQKLGLEKVPCVRLGHMTDTQRRAFIIADNKIALNAGWDEELLKLELSDLKNEDFDLDLIGFSDDELSELLEPDADAEPEEDQAPEPPADPKVQAGDLWYLGDHRLFCGDSTLTSTFDILMQGKKADVVFTSPPYNADTATGDGDIFASKTKKKLYSDGYSDNRESGDYIKFASDVLKRCFENTDGFIFWNVSYNANSRFEYISQIIDFLPHLIEQICWRKTSTIPYKGSLMREWEPIYLFSTNNHLLQLQNVVSNFWQISNQNCQAGDHKACFPVALPTKGIELIPPKTGIVLEPFCGSGTTLVACEALGRACYGVELDPRYCDVIIRRWQDLTGQEARRADGVTFNAVDPKVL